MQLATRHDQPMIVGMKSAMLRSLVIVTSMASSVASAQTRSVRDTATAYGARLTAKGSPADLNANRVNNRLNNRIDNRLSLRIERYRPDATKNPIGVFQTVQDDKSRIVPASAPGEPDPDE